MQSIFMTIKKDNLDFSLKGIANQCGIDLKKLKVEHNTVYGYQLLVDGKRPAGLSSFKEKEFTGYLEGFKDSCTTMRYYKE